MTGDTELLKRRLIELSHKAYQANVFVFSNFLGLAEQDALAAVKPQLAPVSFTAFGGAEGTERVMIRFGSQDDLGYEEPFPIVCLKAEPRAEKFAESLTHRDYLGALMNLGVERDMLGDIILRDKTAYLFAHERIAPYLAETLTRVRRTDVRLSRVEQIPGGALFRTEEVLIQAVGERLDAVVAKVYAISREESLSLFRKKLVFVDGRCCENNSYTPKPNERISVRGFGRFIYRGSRSETRKGKLNLVVEKYV